MLFQIVMNVAIAITWMLFQNSVTLIDGTVGYGIGLLTVYIFLKWRGGRFYIHRVWAVLFFILVCIKEILIANLLLLKIVLSPDMNLKPGIIAVPTQLNTAFEKALFAACMTLTPGTSSIEFSAEGDTIFVHFLNAEDREQAIRSVQDTFEKRILEVTRSHV